MSKGFDGVHYQRRGGEEPVGSGSEVVRVQSPGDLELVEVVFVDLVQRRVTSAREIGAIGGPLGPFYRGGRNRGVGVSLIGRRRATLAARISFALRTKLRRSVT